MHASEHSTQPLPAVSGGRTQPPGRTPKPRKRRRGLRRLMTTLIVIAALLAAVFGGLVLFVSNAMKDVGRIDATQDSSWSRPPAGKGTNILLLGSDSTEATEAGGDGADLTGNRSDSIMVAQVSPGGKVAVMSIMRDNWVEIPGQGEGKINAAMSLGGVPLAVNTVERFIGARIDHVALVDFESFKGLTDAIDGVTVHNEQAFTTADGAYSFEAGDITLSGEEALGFVRERYAFADGDYQRARNQQAYLKGLARSMASPSTLLDPGKLTDSMEALSPHLILDEEFGAVDLTLLGARVLIGGGDMSFFTSPTLGTGTSADGQSIVVPDTEEMAEVQQAVKNGALFEYAKQRRPGSEMPE